MTVRWTENARRELRAIGRFIARDNPAAARRGVARLIARGAGAAKFPRAGRTVPEFGRDDVREVIEGA